MRALKGGKPVKFDPKIGVASGRALASAIGVARPSSSTSLPPVSAAQRQSAANGFQLSPADAQKFEQRFNRMRTRLYMLKPGLILLEPLQAHDGTVVVPAGVTLDADLIWRIWEVAAVKPLGESILVGVPKQTNERGIS
jgi:hypothetical protein